MNHIDPSPKSTRMITVRPLVAVDIQRLKEVIESTGLFDPDLLDDMVSDFLKNPDTIDTWLTALYGDAPAGVLYCAPERLTLGTFNLYLIAVHKTAQGTGIGNALIKHLEELITRAGGRMLIVETSGIPAFDGTRRFYERCGYSPEAVIRDFYQNGEDKVVFRKCL